MTLCLALCSLSACSSIEVGGGDAGALYRLAKIMWNGNRQSVTLAQAASVPYASMGVRIGNGPQTMIVLASDTGTQRLWTSAAHISLETRDGRIMRTAGLAHNLSGAETIRVAKQKDGTRTVQWLADFADLGLYSMPIICRDSNAGAETITILGKAIQTRRINESCQSQSTGLDWSFHDTFWVDPETGLTWRSIQHIHPDFDPVETEILRPPT